MDSITEKPSSPRPPRPPRHPRHPRRPGSLIALALYALLLALFFSPVIFAGKSLNPMLYQPHGVVEGGVYDEMERKPVNSFNVDLATPAYYEFPVNRLVGDLYRRGELPLWNPFQAAGTPLAAQYSTRAFFPYQVIEDMSPVWTWDFFMLGRLLVAGLFTYLFLSFLGLGFPAAFVGGAFHMLSGTFVWFINLEQLVNVAMMTPVVMYAAERLRRAPDRPSDALGPMALMGVSVGLMLLAGQPEVALYVSLLAFLYYFFGAGRLARGGALAGSGLKFAASYALGLMLAAPLLLPFLELVRSGYHIHPVGGDMGSQVLDRWKSVFAYLTPSVTEFPTNPDMISGLGLLVKMGDAYFRFLPVNGVWDTLGGYTGVLLVFVVLTAMLLATSRRGFPWRRPLYFFSFFGFAVILKNVGLPPFVWIGRIPVFDQVWTLRWAAPAWAFAFSAAGAIALELVCAERGSVVRGEPEPTAPPGWPGRYFAANPGMAPTLAFAVLIVLYSAVSFMPVVRLTLARDFFFNDEMAAFVAPSMLVPSILTIIILIAGYIMMRAAVKGGPRVLWALAGLGVLELWWAVPRGYDPVWLMYKLVPFVVGMVAVILMFWDMRREAAICLGVFFVSALALDLTSPQGLPERRDPFAEAPYVEFLRENLGDQRAMGGYGVLFPNYAGALGVRDVRYVNSILPGTFQAFRKNHLHVDAIEEGPSSGLWFSGRPERARATTRTDEEKAGDDRDGSIYYDFWSRPIEEDFTVRLRSYSLLGLKYLMLPRSIDYGIHESVFSFEAYDMKDLPLVYDREVRIYENPGALARVYMAYEYAFADGYEQAQEMATAPGFDIERSVVLEERVDLSVRAGQAGHGAEGTGGGDGGGGGGGGGFITRIAEDRANSVAVDVTTQRPGVLVLTDVHYPGWKVYVDGKKGRLLRVNGVVRGVEVGAGAHRVEFRYSPAAFTAGVAIFALGAAFCVFSFVASRRGRGR